MFDFFQCFELKKKQFSNTLFELPVMSCFRGNFWYRMLNIVSSGSLDGEMVFWLHFKKYYLHCSVVNGKFCAGGVPRCRLHGDRLQKDS